MEEILKSVKESSFQMSRLSADQKNKALEVLRQLILEKEEFLLEANLRDYKEQSHLLSSSLLQRLVLNHNKIKSLVQGIHDLEGMKELIGVRTLHRELDKNLILERITTPLGVVGVIFESRPDAALQIISLLLKSGNAGVLKGGKEAHHTLAAIDQLIGQLVQKCPYLPQNWLRFISTREEVHEMLSYDQYIDLVIPRGSNQLVQSVKSQTHIPVLGHADGICHMFVAADFEVESALLLIEDAKAQYPSACNALETLLVESSLYSLLIEKIKQKLPAIQLILDPESWSVEYGDLKLAVKAVPDVMSAIKHINAFGSHHTDVILTHDQAWQEQFIREVDSANVMVNCSTRFSDGFRYGFGAEVGISTCKTHARGPVGLEGLTIYKYILRGSNHRVKDYVGDKARSFTHHDLH